MQLYQQDDNLKEYAVPLDEKFAPRVFGYKKMDVFAYPVSVLVLESEDISLREKFIDMTQHWPTSGSIQNYVSTLEMTWKLFIEACEQPYCYTLSDVHVGNLAESYADSAHRRVRIIDWAGTTCDKNMPIYSRIKKARDSFLKDLTCDDRVKNNSPQQQLWSRIFQRALFFLTRSGGAVDIFLQVWMVFRRRKKLSELAKNYDSN